MSFLKSLILILLSFGLGFIGWMTYYLGAFKEVTIAEAQRGPFLLIYKDFMGPYHKIVSTIEVMESSAQKQKLNCQLTFGEYLDNPKVSEEARLRSRGGCLLDLTSYSPLEAEKKVTELQKTLSLWPEGAKIELRSVRPYVQAVFSGSPGIGPLKVYPKVADYFNEKRWMQKSSVIEIYEIHSRQQKNAMTTTYLFEIPQK